MDQQIPTEGSELISKFIDEYQSMKKQNSQLQERYDKLQNQYTLESSIEKDNSSKLQVEIKKYQKQSKDFRIEIQNLEAQLGARDNEINDLKRRLDLKTIIDDKNKFRDNSLFVKFLGRKPTPQDQKIVAFINHYENSRERFEIEKNQLIKQMQQVQEQLMLKQREKDSTSQTKEYMENQIEKFQENISMMSNEEKINIMRQQMKKCYNEKQQIQQVSEQMNQHNQDLMAQNQKLRHELVDNFNLSNGQNTKKSSVDHSFTLQNKENMMAQTNMPASVERLMKIFNARSEEELLYTAEKVGQVMQSVQRLEQFCRQVCCEILYGDCEDVEQVIPTIKRMKSDAKLVESLLYFREKVVQTMGLEIGSTDKIIIDTVVQVQQNSRQVQDLQQILGIGENENFQNRMNQICMQIQDIHKFVRIAKMVLDLDEGMRTEVCLTYILKILEKIKAANQ